MLCTILINDKTDNRPRYIDFEREPIEGSVFEMEGSQYKVRFVDHYWPGEPTFHVDKIEGIVTA